MEHDDEMGYDDIVGDDDYVGATRPRALARRPPGLKPDQNIRTGRQGVARRQISPMPLTTIAAGATVAIVWQPQRIIRLERLVLAIVGAGSLGDLLVGQIKVGAENQLVNDGSVTALMFAFDSFATSFAGNTAQPSTQITVSITNASAGALVVSGGFIGTSITFG